MNYETLITIQPLEKLTSFGRSYGSFVNNKLIDHHFCSNDSFARFDLGERRKTKYEELFPNGYKIVFVDLIKEDKE